MNFTPTPTASPKPVVFTDLAWLRVAIGIATIGYATIVAVRVLVFHSFAVAVHAEWMTAVACAVAWIAYGRWPRAAGLLALSVVWLELAYTLYAVGGTEVTAILVFPVLIIVVGLLLGERWAAGWALATGLAIPCVIYAGRWVHSITDGAAETAISVVMVEIILVYAAILARVILHAFRDLLGKSERLRLRYTRLFQATPDALLEIDQRGRIAEANSAAERLFGANREQLLGQSLNDMLARSQITPGLVAGDIRPGLPVLLSAGANRYEVVAGVAPETSGAALLVVRDVTKRHQLMEKQALSERLETVGQLAAGIAHEFNNLLTSIGGNASLIRLHPDREIQNFAAQIMTAQQRAATLTRQLLAFARHDFHQPEVISLGRELVEWVELLRHMAGENCRLELKGEGAGWVRVDPVQIEQILGNLVNNARDASPKGGVIELRLGRLSRGEAQALGSTLETAWQVMLEVADQGQGMTPEVSSRLFEPFFTTKPQGQGSGLGLAAVHGLVVQNGGSIEIASAPGQGTTARIFFPEVAAPGGPLADKSPSNTTPIGHVLLVDDDTTACRTAVAALEQEGCQVTIIVNGFEAVKFHRQPGAGVDLVIASLTLPALAGRELVERLRAHNPVLPALFVCGRFDVPRDWPADERKFPLLLKPFRPEDLLRHVRALLPAKGK